MHVETCPGFCTSTYARTTLLHRLLSIHCLTLVYNLINCHLWDARTRLFPFRFYIVHSSLCITFSPTLFLHHKRIHSPKLRRGESEWIPRSTPDGFAYVFNFVATYLGDLQLPVCIMMCTLVAVYFASCSISKHEHPLMASFSVTSFSVLHFR